MYFLAFSLQVDTYSLRCYFVLCFNGLDMEVMAYKEFYCHLCLCVWLSFLHIILFWQATLCTIRFQLKRFSSLTWCYILPTQNIPGSVFAVKVPKGTCKCNARLECLSLCLFPHNFSLWMFLWYSDCQLHSYMSFSFGQGEGINIEGANHDNLNDSKCREHIALVVPPLK